jgi:hypothetical protein
VITTATAVTPTPPEGAGPVAQGEKTKCSKQLLEKHTSPRPSEATAGLSQNSTLNYCLNSILHDRPHKESLNDKIENPGYKKYRYF